MFPLAYIYVIVYEPQVTTRTETNTTLLKMATIEAAFKTTLKNVKNALQGNGSTLNIYSTYFYEQSSHIVLLFAGTERPSKTEPIWGLFPDKGPRKKLGQGYALYHRDTFLH